MKNYILSLAALCAFSSMHASVREDFSLEKIAQTCGEIEMAFIQHRMLYEIRGLQDWWAARKVTLDQVKEMIAKNWGPLKNIPNDNSEQSMMLKQALEMFKEVLAAVSDVTRNNQIPALDDKMVQKGVDVQASRLQVLELIEAAIK